MNRLILKTTAITFVSVIGACLLTFGAFALFSPVTIAKLFDGMGNYSASVLFYEMQYNKSGSFEDLQVLAGKLDEDNDSKRTESYLEKLISSDEFFELVGAERQEFYYGKYVVALSINGRHDQAVKVSSEFVDLYGYTIYNPFHTLISERATAMTVEQLDSLISELEGFSNLTKEQETMRDGYLEILYQNKANK